MLAWSTFITTRTTPHTSPTHPSTPPHTHTHTHTVPTPSHIEGDYFLVERYESDVEDDDSLSTSGHDLGHSGRGWPVQGSRDSQMLIVLTERFIEEQTAKGKVLK